MTLDREIRYHGDQCRQWIEWTTGTRWGSLDEVYHHARQAAHYALIVLGRHP